MKVMLVCNWKMNPETYREAKTLFDATKKAADRTKNIQVIVAPPAIFLRELSKGYRGGIAFGIQNGFAEPTGAHTGEISYAQAKDAHASYAIIGHAERRAMGETNEIVRSKVAAALKSDLSAILCVGEQSRTGTGEYFPFIREQLRVGLQEIQAPMLKKIIIAYEPVWAIGAAKPMTPRDMHEMSIFIRKTIVEFYGDAGMDIKILYGGSIDETTAKAMLTDGDVRGLLVGRASAETKHITNLLAILA
jgi:triosephosphate isomerase (TIM)